MVRRAFLMQARRIPGWKIALAAALGAVVLVAILTLAFAAFLVIAPLAAIGGAVAGWLGLRRARRAAARPSADATVIDAEFVVIEQNRAPPRPEEKDAPGPSTMPR